MAVNAEETGIVPIIEQELEEFDANMRAFRSGEKDPIAFQVYRLREGVYGQRQADAQMIRVKVPGGVLTARQLEVLGEVARNYAPLDRGHITTRECIQYHHVPLEEASQAKWQLAKVGITSREACGNTVRNVISCPMAGVCATEVFDVTPYLAAFVRYFIRKPFTQTMPRKFKSSFSPCVTDCANAPYHDIGFIAQMQGGQKGFKVFVGGGSSIMPRAAQVLYDFVPVEEYLRVSEAVLRVFNKSDELRKNRMMARIKVLIDRIGMDAFKGLVETELKEDWAKDPIDPTPYMLNNYEKTPPPATAADLADDSETDPAYLHWKATNAVPQRQPGYSVAYLKVAQGDLSSAQFDALARISREFGNGYVRLDFEQDLAVRWVPNAKLPALYRQLVTLNLADAGVHEITDVTSCPGTDSCKLGITASMGANRALSERLIELDIVDPLTRQMHVKVSGCPNGCGRHHLGDIGFQGAAVKGEDGHQVPAYEVYIGGRYVNGEFRYAKRVSTKLPAKRVPDATERIITYYEGNRSDGETFDLFVDRVGHGAFETLLADMRDPGTVADNFPLYEDWERRGFYKLERGEGECAV